MTKNRIRKMLRGLVCLVLLVSLCTNVVSAEESSEVENGNYRGTIPVRVGFFAFDGYHMQDDNEERSGYGYELLQLMAGFEGFSYEYIGYEKSWAQMQDMLENGEIDLLTSAQKTEERQEKFDFSDLPIGTSSAILTVKAGNNEFDPGGCEEWDGIRIGMLEDNSRNEDLAEYAFVSGFTYESVYYSSTEELTKALQEGEAVDAILTSNLRSIDNEWTIAEFAFSQFYVMVKKGNTELLDRVNDAISKLDVHYTGFRTILKQKYYGVPHMDVVSLTNEEREYIESLGDKKITVLLNPDLGPYSYISKGKIDGLFFAIAKLAEKRSGLSFEFLITESRNEYDKVWASGEADVCFDVPDSLQLSENNNYYQTKAYIEIPIARLHKKNVTTYRSAAVVKGINLMSQRAEELENQEIILVEYDTVDQAVEAVMSGKQDMCLLPEATAQLKCWENEKNQLVSETYYGLYTAYAAGVRKDTGTLLYSIIYKSVLSIDEATINELSLEYTTMSDKPFTLVGFIYDNPMQVSILVAVFLIVVVLCVELSRAVKKRKLATKRMQEEKRQAELLRSALDAAEQAGLAKSFFLSRVSHEMRTPLNAIVGFLELSKGADAVHKENYRGNCEIAAKQLVSVINDVLDMSSIESGKMKISNAAFNFKQLICAITNIYFSQCAQKNVSFETKLVTPTEEWLIGDQLRVNQILINLLGNAVKFTQSGSISLSISQKETIGNKAFLRFEVKDTGCGVSESMINRLFLPFEQEDASTALKYGGSGLGLSIVKNLVGLMDGAIKVESKQGVGSTFTVDLPFEKCENRSQMQTISGVENLSVLVVDDDPVEREYLGVVLKRMDLHFNCVADCDTALDELSRSEQMEIPYNICLVDWRMPNKDGAETTRLIRQKYGSKLIVIVVSAYDHEQAEESARKAGANLFIPKPLFQSSLFDFFMSLTGGQIKRKETTITDYHFPGKRVLLAEDNEMNRLVAKTILQRMGIECVEANDGQIAYDTFLNSKPDYFDAILMDMQMPRVSGVEATRRIRNSEHPSAKTISIIALTANAFAEDVTKALSVGMNAHVAKPIEIKALAEALAEAFEK